MMLLGRRNECAALDGLLGAARTGRSGALVVRGEPGIGKTALLEDAIERASDLKVVRAVGVESEMELAFAALHQLSAPMLDRLELLPSPQRNALAITFGLSEGAVPDRFLVGLAVLTLLSEVAVERPLVWVVDDAQWLDRASAQVLGFVARRLMAESVVILFATREPSDELRTLTELVVVGLGAVDAQKLLTSVIPWPLDERVRQQIVAESRGNPLALLELPRGLSAAHLAGGLGLPQVQAVSGRIEEGFRQRLEALPPDTQRLLLAVAAEPAGDPSLLWRAGYRLGISRRVLEPAESAGLLEVGTRVRFRHPLARSAIYRAASPEQRRQVHRALADASDRDVDADRRAWHMAEATADPDEDVAAELEQAAGRARSRGGLGAAAAFLERAAILTPDSPRRAERALAAANAAFEAGSIDDALALLDTAEAGVLDELQRARAHLLRGQIAFAAHGGSDAPPLLLKAARELEAVDARLARETYLDAWGAALFAGHLARGGSLHDVSRAARAAPEPTWPPRPCDLLLDALALLITEGPAAAPATATRAAKAFSSDDVSIEEELRWGWLAPVPAAALWDYENWHAIQARQVRLARDAGFFATLPIRLVSLSCCFLLSGDFREAASLIAESEALALAMGARALPHVSMALDAFRGREVVASELVEAAVEGATEGDGHLVSFAQWAASIRYNGMGLYEEALAAAGKASRDGFAVHVSNWALPEEIEAAVRTANPEVAADALERLAETTAGGGTDWGLGIEARSRALLSDGPPAEDLYREAIARLSRAGLLPDLARAHLLYGEWLRREQRRVDARDQLKTAHSAFVTMGAEAFAERTRIELLATGEAVRRHDVHARDDLTPQEAQIARLAGEGHTNPEIGARLFLSPRTVEWHLHKVFTKLGVSSRKELPRALRGPDRELAAI